MNCPGMPGQNNIGKNAQSVVAVEATMGRLERAFDAAVSQVWHFKDLF